MTNHLGTAGRRAANLAPDQMQVEAGVHSLAPAPSAISEGPRTVVQRSADSQSAAEGGVLNTPSHSTGAGRAVVEREALSPSPEEVADRVYQLLRQDLRWERERRGRW